MRTIVINGEVFLWREILALRREQKKLQRKHQLTLFELKTDKRPESQAKASGRFKEPLLFS